ncbi:type I glyceraldehyde-3-phosphate dehydrogenase [Putridiphycobacter roseus]|uniref:Type I glyceraldehyde-3-phosphate dehydrogenase n=1 Tax=Putridiphycobacter roseus TaxID=2219161 RepID=A0A2W1NQT3_9FLAO|nr:type I glyceraldehyde-3-phosphate dehydrogenase [Putridiphycobacter roseus]PZE18012.1 type I glyceraldehyde-3-phosphate dehydrogenase [Putridiphycobacter roseus]
MAIKIGINGFGRIGRYFTRLAIADQEIEIVAINDLANAATLAHLFKYDSIHRQFDGAVAHDESHLIINNHPIKMTQFKDPGDIPWGEMGVDIVIECSGLFRTRPLASKHLQAGAKKVILSAPPKDDSIQTVVIGINENVLTGKEDIISNASCTTNSAAPLVKVIKTLGQIESCFITTVHSYTSDQRLQDAPHADLRRARAAAESIVPTTTGAAKAITKIFPELEGAMGGCGIRVPVPDGSLTDMTFIMDKQLTVAEINAAFLSASKNDLKGLLYYMEDPIVSRDIIGSPYSTTFDSLLTSVIGKMVKVVAWYDNEAGYSNRLLDLVKKVG